MRAIATTLADWILSRPEEYIEVEFYEIRLTNGAVLRYTSYPGTIVLTDPPPAGGRSAITVQPLGGSGQAFNGIFGVTAPANFGVNTVDGVTLMVVSTIPGDSLGHILPTITASSNTWALISTNIALNANQAVMIYAADTTAGSDIVQFGGTGFPLGLIGRMVVYSIGVTQAVGTPNLDSDTSFPATGSTLSSTGIGGFSSLSTTSTLPMIIAINSQANLSTVASQVPSAGWANVQGIYNDVPNPSPWASDPISIAVTYNGALGQLSSATVSAWPGVSVSENALTLVAISNDTAAPAPSVTTWIGTDVQIIGDGDPAGDTPPIPAAKCTLSGAADQMALQLGFWPADADMPQSLVGATTWPNAIRNKLFRDAGFTLYRAYWPDLDSLMRADPPIGWGDLDQYGDAFDGLVNMFDGYVTKISDTDRLSSKFMISDGRCRLEIDFPRYQYGRNCRHVLFSTGCGANKASFTVTGTMGTPTANGFSYTSGQPAGYFAQGAVTFDDPELGTITLTVAADTGTAITLVRPFPTIPTAGTAFSMTAGCDHTTGTNGCPKFSRQASYGGFLYVPPPRTVTG